jgi:hypothetical protein
VKCVGKYIAWLVFVKCVGNYISWLVFVKCAGNYIAWLVFVKCVGNYIAWLVFDMKRSSSFSHRGHSYAFNGSGNKHLFTYAVLKYALE